MDKKAAILCARVCIGSYLGKVDSPDFQLTARFENKGTDTQGLFGVAFGDTLVIAFRGSEETGIADWITDLKFLQTAYPYGGADANVKVHYGFLEAYQSVRDAILNEAKKSPHKKFVCTGHSLGGGLATLAILDIGHTVPHKELACYTFGSPKVGNQQFVALYNKKVPNTFRCVNGADSVPAIPPGNYYHVEKLVQIGDVAAALKEALVEKVEDHFPHNYLKVLQALA